jgi:hypothetical protein
MGAAIGAGAGGLVGGLIGANTYESKLAAMKVRLAHAITPWNKRKLEEEIAKMEAMGKKNWILRNAGHGAMGGALIGGLAGAGRAGVK